MLLSALQKCEFTAEYERIMPQNKEQMINHLKIILGKVMHFYMRDITINTSKTLPEKFIEALSQMNTLENVTEGACPATTIQL